jgi:hypothetical protein
MEAMRMASHRVSLCHYMPGVNYVQIPLNRWSSVNAYPQPKLNSVATDAPSSRIDLRFVSSLRLTIAWEDKMLGSPAYQVATEIIEA